MLPILARLPACIEGTGSATADNGSAGASTFGGIGSGKLAQELMRSAPEGLRNTGAGARQEHA